MISERRNERRNYNRFIQNIDSRIAQSVRASDC
jgi:flagellar biosynthesis chaperone FliJ